MSRIILVEPETEPHRVAALPPVLVHHKIIF
jgi:hypothetical protein